MKFEIIMLQSDGCTSQLTDIVSKVKMPINI